MHQFLYYSGIVFYVILLHIIINALLFTKMRKNDMKFSELAEDVEFALIFILSAWVIFVYAFFVALLEKGQHKLSYIRYKLARRRAGKTC